MKYCWLLILLIFSVSSQIAFGQENKRPVKWLEQLDKYKIKPVVALQLWTTYTIDEQVFDETKQEYISVDNRLNTQLRRSRFGLKGQPFTNWKFNLTAAIDLVGRDVLAGTYGGGNNGASPQLRLWNAFIQWRALSKKDYLHLTFGYFTPRIGRASITNPWKSTSLEKSWSQNYLRRHLVGTGPGRAAGLNLGGVIPVRKNYFQINYDLGIFNPLFTANGGNSTGQNAASLFVGRVAGQFGDPEFNRYQLGHQVNYFGERNGLSVGLAAAHQGETDLFSQSQTLSADFLFNWHQTNIDGEWSWCLRNGSVDGNGEQYETQFQTGYLRASQNFILPSGYVFETVIMVMQMRGATASGEQAKSTALGSFSGEDSLMDLGFNLYFTPNLKLGLHYNHQLADKGSAPVGATVNNFFVQSGVGPIYRGDWVGFGLSAIF